ncbi:interferon-induced protein 44-like isoform X2 [Mercenaria mercenaria]|nr:interferon-induced protein 44-like isoform X2 [Mercenaria mercenaria]XP_053403835.1 interferon-induced protein 44-like isoform X2 [Mercenaria mercenaria]XP_053403844.1 interferon-induced protein 44-like isoform X2 [Mercenaria mercenaria]
MAGRLSIVEKKQLERFIHAGPKDFNLLYSFTRDGADATIFHQMCDNKGPTVTIVYNTLETVYGGYTEKSWTSGSGQYCRDEHAFLFGLQQNGKVAPVKCPVKVIDSAIYCKTTHGPVFGSGPDLVTFTGTLSVQDDKFTTNANYSFGNCYDMGGISTDQFTNNIKTVTELEVYSVTDSTLVPVWREMEGGWDKQDMEELKNEMDSWSPPHRVGLKSANILFLGPVGAGKSSFFNTIASIFRGHVTGQAVCGSAEQSITSKYQMYRVRGSALAKPMKFKLCDTRGIEENQGIDGTELNYLLEGNVPNGYQFNPSTPISPDISGFISSPTLNQKIHCVCFIIDGSTATVMSERMLEKIKSLQTKVRQKGISQVVLVTKIDKVCSHVEEDVFTVFQSVAIQELVDKVSDIFGVPRSHVLPVKNFEKEIFLRNDVSILALLSLRQILRATEDFMFNLLDFIDDKKKDSESSE